MHPLQQGKKKQQKGKMATVTGYVEEVQSSLSDAAFKRFKDVMFMYKQVREYVFTQLITHVNTTLVWLV